MVIVLCKGCGRVQRRYTTICDRCTRTDMEYYSDPKSARLKMRIKQITGRASEFSPAYSSMLVLSVATAITALGYYFYNGQSFAPKKVATASTMAAVPR